jgi:hypothetical protein
MYDKFAPLLEQALTEPGIVSQAFRRFHRFSVGNQILAAVQLRQKCSAPVAHRELQSLEGTGSVRLQGTESALAVDADHRQTSRHQHAVSDDSGDPGSSEEVFTRFKLAPRWFSLEQTEGEAYAEPVESPHWDAEAALAALDITQEHFDYLDGNVEGYAVQRRIAVSQLAENPHSVRFHEMAHVVLGHTLEADCHDTSSMPRSVREAEAESVAFLLCSLLELPGRDESRGYIQSWLKGGQLPERSVQRIFSASQKILEAGRSVGQPTVTH